MDKVLGKGMLLIYILFLFLFFCYSFDSFVSRCSVTNTELQVNEVAAEDEVQEDMSAVEMECPIVHLNHDILQTDSLTLLTEGTYVDSLLTTLPVCVIY